MVTLKINGTLTEVNADPETPILWVLREQLKLTGSKYGCGISVCGNCTILLNDEPVQSCVMPLKECIDKHIQTIEGLAVDGNLHPIQQAWLDESVPECGYCQSGQIMAALALLKKHPIPTDTEIDTAMSKILCRCGTYLRIKKAIKRVSRMNLKTDEI